MTADDFMNAMDRDISARAADIISAKPQGEKYLNLADMKALTAYVGELCQTELGGVPQQVIISCKLALAVLAPANEKIVLLREVLSMSRGLSGVGSIITAIGTALGWSGSAIAVIVAFMTGANLMGLIGLSAVVGYFFFLASPASLSEKALAVLHQSVRIALTEHCKNNVGH